MKKKDNVRASFHHMTRTRKNPAFNKYLEKMTTEQVLDKLPFPYNEMAKRNCKYLNEESLSSVRLELYTAFIWSETPEGFDFWSAIEDECEYYNL